MANETQQQEKNYTFLGVRKTEGQNGPGAYGVIREFVPTKLIKFNDDNGQPLKNSKGQEYIRLSVGVQNTGKRLTGAYGDPDPQEETLWVNVVITDDQYGRVSRLRKAFETDGNAIGVTLIGNFARQESAEYGLSYTMFPREVQIFWKEGYKAPVVGGDYSVVDAVPAKTDKSAAYVAFEGYLGKDGEVSTLQNGGEVLNTFSILNQPGGKLNWALDLPKVAKGENQLVGVQVWPNQNFSNPRSPIERAEKVMKKGAGVIVFGYATTYENNNGETNVQISVDSFELLRSPKGAQQGGQQSTGANAGNANASNATPPADDPFEASAADDVITDDDLPF